MKDFQKFSNCETQASFLHFILKTFHYKKRVVHVFYNKNVILIFIIVFSYWCYVARSGVILGYRNIVSNRTSESMYFSFLRQASKEKGDRRQNAKGYDKLHLKETGEMEYSKPCPY